MLPDDGRPRWSPRVPRNKIRRLYETDAQGILDTDLIDEVGWALWERCESILVVTAAHNGRVTCPSCGALIERPGGWSDEETIACAACNWRLPWAAYHQTYRGKQLFGANATSAFEAYHQAFPKAQAGKEKMLLIDQLIHAFHIGLTDIGRPAAANLIEGSLKDVIHFLDALTNGPASAAGLGDTRQAWRQTLAAASWTGPFIPNKEDPETS